MTDHLPNARRLAWMALLAEAPQYPTRKLDSLLRQFEPSPADRALAQELVRGVLRRQGTLDAVALAYATNRLRGTEVMVALRLGLAQMLFLDSVPDHAALATTMEAVKPELGGRAAFVNALLRAVQRGVSAQNAADLSLEDPAHLPVDDVHGWSFDRPVFVGKDEFAVHAARLSYPPALLRRWHAELGTEGMCARAKVLNQPPQLWIRVNPLRATAAQVVDAFAAEGFSMEGRRDYDEGMTMLRPSRHNDEGKARAIPNLPGFAEGWWSVQDPTSFESVLLAKPQPEEKVLDLCAAPGGKSFAAWELMGGKGRVLACDLSPHRLETMKTEAARLGHDIEMVVLDEESHGQDWDLILADVPCTNTGVLHKRPEARWRFHKKELHRLTTLQDLFRKTHLLPHCGPTSRILWSTCSLEPEEDGQAVERLARKSGRVIDAERLFEPAEDRSGGFAACLIPS